MAKTGYLFNEEYLKHYSGSGHPESPARLKAVHNKIIENNIINDLESVSPLGDQKIVKESILRIHSPSHYNSIIDSGAPGRIPESAVAGVLGAVSDVMEGKIKNAFCAVRPPGHHAHNNGADCDGSGQGEGFCFFNNIAIAARYAQDNYACGQILILDWDYHHGNGTEWAFYSDPSVFFFSTHSLFDYPATGFDYRTGTGAGENFNLNVPLHPGAGDGEILSAWKNKLLPAIEKLNFSPDLVLISAGFDSRKDDPLGDFNITDSGFSKLTKIAMEIAGKNSSGKIVSILEGGYNPEGLAEAVFSHISELSG